MNHSGFNIPSSNLSSLPHADFNSETVKEHLALDLEHNSVSVQLAGSGRNTWGKCCFLRNSDKLFFFLKKKGQQKLQMLNFWLYLVACFSDEVEMRENISSSPGSIMLKCTLMLAVVGGRAKHMNNIWVGLCLMGSVQRASHTVKRAKSRQLVSLLWCFASSLFLASWIEKTASWTSFLTVSVIPWHQWDHTGPIGI